MEEQRGTKEEVKEGTKDGPSQGGRQELKEEVKAASSLTVNVSVTNAAVKGTSPPTAHEARMK